jgi:hypothetical protein
MRICLSNLVFGDRYTDVFLNYHLRSLVDDSNLCAFNTDGCEYLIFTDGENTDKIKEHFLIKRLSNFMPVKIILFSAGENKYNQRYSIQGFQTKVSARHALERDSLLVLTSADTVYGANFWVNVIDLLQDRGVDGILSHPMRVGFEGVSEKLKKSDKALTADELFDLCFLNQHPLWLAQNWGAPFFSRMPYHLLWSDSQSLVVRPFSISPIVFKPTWDMVNTGGNADIYITQFLKNPYYLEDWSELPWAEIGFVSSWFPPFSSHPASTLRVSHWAKKVILPQNIQNLRRAAYFKRQSTPIPNNLLHESGLIAEEIISLVNMHPG